MAELLKVNIFTKLPQPLPDESVYSLLSRYHILSGNKSLYRTKVLILGVAVKISITGHESNSIIDFMYRSLDLRYDQFEERFTIQPFWRWVYTGNSYVLLALNKQLNSQKCCKSCMYEDVSQYGVAYWHRSHQPPGVIVCHKHGHYLYLQEHISHVTNFLRIPDFLSLNKKCKLNRESFKLEKTHFARLLDRANTFQALSIKEYAKVTHEILNISNETN